MNNEDPGAIYIRLIITKILPYLWINATACNMNEGQGACYIISGQQMYIEELKQWSNSEQPYTFKKRSSEDRWACWLSVFPDDVMLMYKDAGVNLQVNLTGINLPVQGVEVEVVHHVRDWSIPRQSLKHL